MGRICAPIALFVYNRPHHTRRTIDALASNVLADQSELFVFCDGPKEDCSREVLLNIEETRRIVQSEQRFKKVRVKLFDKNKGLAASIIDGVSQLVDEHGRLIVLEDDIVTSPLFLQYMNTSLDKYEREEQVMSISGYFYPVKKRMPEFFFLQFDSSWGWGTWKRAWDKFNPDSGALLNMIEDREKKSKFNFEGAFDFYEMLSIQHQGTIDSWSIRWYASILLENGLTLYPAMSFVQNIGNDGSGRHSPKSRVFDTKLTADYKKSSLPLEIQEDKLVRAILSSYFKQVNKIGMVDRIRIKWSQIIGK